MRKLAGILSIGILVGMMWTHLPAETPESKAEADATQSEPAAAQIAEEIRQRLHDPITINLEQVPLTQALDQILKQHDFEYWFDQKMLAEESINTDEIEITCNLKNVSYRAALKRILAGANLAWVCEDAGIRITTRTNAERSLFARVYDVADLMAGDVEEEAPKLGVPPGGTGATTSNQPVPSRTVQFGGLGGVVDSSNKPKATLSKDKILIKAVQELVGGPPFAPWSEADGEGGTVHYIQTANAKLLVIKQTEAAHGEVEDLLNDLLSHDRMGAGEEAEGPPAAKNASRTSPVKPRLRMVRLRATH